MKLKAALFCLLAIVILTSCGKNGNDEELKIDPNNLLIGYWSDPAGTDSSVVYSRVSGMPENKYGFALLPGGKYLMHTSSGFCGTPPVVYADYEGTWELNDSILTVSSEYWGGTMQFSLHIFSVTKDQFVAGWIYDK